MSSRSRVSVPFKLGGITPASAKPTGQILPRPLSKTKLAAGAMPPAARPELLRADLKGWLFKLPKGSRLTTIRRFGQPGFRSRFEGPNLGCFSCRTEGRLIFAVQGQRGGCTIKKRGGVPAPHSLNSFVFCGLPLLFGFHNDDTEKSGETIATPPKRGVPTVPDSGLRHRASIPAPGGRYRRYLSLREGSEQTPFPLALHRVGSVLAVKGSLRRFAPWTAPVRSERRAAYEGKGGVRIRPPAYQPRKAGGFLVSDSSRSLPNGADRPRTSIEEAPIFRLKCQGPRTDGCASVFHKSPLRNATLPPVSR